MQNKSFFTLHTEYTQKTSNDEKHCNNSFLDMDLQTENPCVLGSIPRRGNFFVNNSKGFYLSNTCLISKD